MLELPNMVMIGGNSRNSGKTTMACSIIRKFSANHEVIGLKVSSIRPGEEIFHGEHNGELLSGYSVFEEVNSDSEKDTSKMLRSGAAHVYFIRAHDKYIDQAILHFISMYINNQVIVCESRSLRSYVIPGLFVMMMRLPVSGTEKDISSFLSKADHVIYGSDELNEVEKFVARLNYEHGRFILT